MSRSLSLLLAVFLITGCESQSLYTQLTEREANQILALMFKAGMPAEKISEKDETFAVHTEKAHFAEAMALLQRNGLPPDRYDSLGSVFEKEGFVSSPLEERARLNHALSQEISQTISSIDGVLSARVHLAVPEQDPLSKVKRPSSASVFIKHRVDVALDDQVMKIKALVVDGMENLSAENVTVALFPAININPILNAPTIHPTVTMQKSSIADAFSNPLALLPLGLVLMVCSLVFWARQRFGKTLIPIVNKPVDSTHHNSNQQRVR